MPVTRESQKRMAKLLQAKYGQRSGGKKTRGLGKGVMRVWANANYGGWRKMVPKVGQHRVKARPVAGPLYRKNRDWAIRSAIKLYSIKIRGERYSKDWASQ